MAITSYAMVGDRERTLQAGCTGYIEKPIDPETFVDEVKKYHREICANESRLAVDIRNKINQPYIKI